MSLTILVWIFAAVGSYISLIWLAVYFRERGSLKDEYAKLTNPKSITVMLPAYNEEKHIENAIESLLKSDYPKNKLEIIVVNDGSTDNTKQIIERYAKRNLIRVISQPNQGKGVALNNALKHAKGELFGVMDADTIVEKDTLRKLVVSFKGKKLGAIISAIKPLRTKTILERFQKIEYLLAILARKLMEKINTNYVTPGALSLYDKNLIAKLGGFEHDNLTEDLEMGLRLRSKGYDIKASTDACTYTEVPYTFLSLLKQRVRWNRGFLKNIWKYRHMVFNSKYELLGLYQLVIALTSVFILIPFGYATSGYFLYQNIHNAYLHFTSVGFKIDFFNFPTSLESFILGINNNALFPLIVSVSLATILTVLACKLTRESYKNILIAIPTIMLYYPIIGLIWMISLSHEILRIKRKW